MSANVLRQDGHEEFANSLAAFAEALFGLATVGGSRSDYLRTKAVARAMVAARLANEAAEARVCAYRSLIQSFLGAAEAQELDADPPAPAMAMRLRKPRSAEAELVLGAVQRLAPLEKAALLLVVVERFSYAEAAVVMEMDALALRSALARGREAFAARLASTKGGGRAHLRLVG